RRPRGRAARPPAPAPAADALLRGRRSDRAARGGRGDDGAPARRRLWRGRGAAQQLPLRQTGARRRNPAPFRLPRRLPFAPAGAGGAPATRPAAAGRGLPRAAGGDGGSPSGRLGAAARAARALAACRARTAGTRAYRGGGRTARRTLPRRRMGAVEALADAAVRRARRGAAPAGAGPARSDRRRSQGG